MLKADEGYFFGIGAFETIAVENGQPIFFEMHLERLQRAMNFLGLPSCMREIRQKAAQALSKTQMQTGRNVLKIAVSAENIVISTRKNNYLAADYEKGFTADYSTVRRNETSEFTYHKTLNYGDCLFEKRRAKARGIDEPVFLNMKGEICEGASTNIFFVKDAGLYTPPVNCGLLPGIMRNYVLEHYPVTERVILPQEAASFDEMFVTNSLLGIMPVRKLGKKEFSSRETGERLMKEYFRRWDKSGQKPLAGT